MAWMVELPVVQTSSTIATRAPAHQRKTQREIGVGAQILSNLNIRSIRLLTNHPKRVAALEGFGISIVEQVPVPASKSIAK